MQNLVNQIARYQEIERRGLLEKLPIEKQQAWAEVKRRGLDKKILSGEQIGTSQPAEPVKAPYSTMDKAKYALRSAGEGATFGLGDVVAGYVGAQARNLADYTHGKDLKTRAKGLGKLAFGIISPEDFKKERADFIKEQEDFAKHHGGLNFAGELAGGLVTGIAGAGKSLAKKAGEQSLKQIAKQSGKEGFKFGAAYGAGSGLTKDAEELRPIESAKDAVKGAIGGGIAGVLIPAGAVGAKQGVEKFLGTQGYAKRAAKKIFEEAGGKSLGKIVRSTKGVRALKEAIKADDTIAERVRDVANDHIINSAEKTKQIVNDSLGIDNVVSAKEKAKALYDAVLNQSNIEIPITIYKNQGTREALKQAIKKDYFGDLKEKGLNSLSVAQRAKEQLDTMIENSYVLGDHGVRKSTSDTYNLERVRKDFLNTIDKLVPEYKSARKEYEDATKAYDLLLSLNKDSGQERTNTIKAILSNKNKKFIRDVFGKEKAEKLFADLGDQSIENDRFTRLYNAAENKLTKEKPLSQGWWREVLETVGSLGGHLADVARIKGITRGRRNIGRILLDSAGRDEIKQNWNGMRSGGSLVRKGFKPDTQITTEGLKETNYRYSDARKKLMKNNGERIRDIYENGAITGPEANKHPRTDDKKAWYRISEINKEGDKNTLVIGDNGRTRVLYEVQAGKKEGISGRSGSNTGAANSLTNSIVKILGNVKAKMGQKNSVSIEEVLKQAGYKVPVILKSKENK